MNSRFLKKASLSVSALLCLTACGAAAAVATPKSDLKETESNITLKQEITTSEPTTESPTEPFYVDVKMPRGHKIAQKSVIKNFETVMQEPELPTGCEVTALCQTLNFLGFDIDKVELADEFMPIDFEGATTMNHAYIGDPKFYDGFGCLPPVIVQTADDYFESVNSPCYAVDMSDTKLEELFYQIEQGRPLILWATIDLWECPTELMWTTADGEEMWFNGMQHCLVIYGYDLDKKIVYAADPLVGNIEYDLERFERMFEIMEEKAVVICGDSKTEGVYNPDKDYKKSKFLSRNAQEKKKEEEEKALAEKEEKERKKAEKEAEEQAEKEKREQQEQKPVETAPHIERVTAATRRPVQIIETEPPTEYVAVPSETPEQPYSEPESSSEPEYVPVPETEPVQEPIPEPIPETDPVPAPVVSEGEAYTEDYSFD